MNAMAEVAQNRGRAAARARHRVAWRGWLPLHAWGTRRRLAVALAIAVLAGVLLSGACIVWDPLRVRAERVSLADAQMRRDHAQQALARLPALREAAARTPARASYVGNSAEDIRRISQLAAQSGLVLHMLEPGAPGGAKGEAFRSIKLVAQGSFAQLLELLEGFAREPALTAPDELAIRRAGAGLSITAALRVYDALPAVRLASAPAEASAPDPFARTAAAGPGNDGWRLAGILQDRQRIVALLETPEGVVTAQAGQAIGNGVVEQVGPARVVVFASGARRALNWAEGAK
ncbi:hypothetical protein [Paraburkholderia lycopersici]|uniref:Tfp pilus assembly protein PilO n=1 Tax=Paraburkholderia lycopersici TaxID=416944 RepID=A0A1G6Y9F3_9BURK|nr:hypothetical protein [Paraburkholderia lycopersici]SDD86980.1 hypothetical protein SAMN05421548_12759 [Paraburkholderia lycopersici]